MRSVLTDADAASQQTVSNAVLNWALLAVLTLGLALRMWGIGFGLPYDFTPDEIHEIVRALKLGAGEYSWTPGKGGLYLILFVEYGFLYVFHWLTGTVSGSQEFAIRFLQDPSEFYLAGRITVALMGTATCWVIYRVAKRLYDWRVALVAAFFGATAYYHGLWSHYINVDIGMTLAVWLAILAYLKFEEDGRIRWAVTAGAMGGVAFAFKLPGAIVVFPLLLAILTAWDRKESFRKPFKQAAIILAAMAVAATIVAPENVLSVGNFHTQFANLANGDGGAKVVQTGTAAASGFDSAVRDVTVLRGATYPKLLLRDTNIALSLLALVGAAFGVWRRNRWDILFAATFVVFVGVMAAADRPASERYLLPVVPVLWLLAARAASIIAGNRTWVLAAIVGLTVIVPLSALAKQNYEWTLPDSRVIAKQWIEENVPEDSRLLMDGMRYRFIQSPPLIPNSATLQRRIDAAAGAERVSRGVNNNMLTMYADAMSQLPGPKYDLFSTIYGLRVKPLDYYVDQCFDYVVTSSQNVNRYATERAAEKYPDSHRFYSQLPADPRVQLVFAAGPSAWEVQGPEINVYRVISDCK